MTHDEIRNAVARIVEITSETLNKDPHNKPEDLELIKLGGELTKEFVSGLLDLNVTLRRVADAMELIANPMLRLKELEGAAQVRPDEEV